MKPNSLLVCLGVLIGATPALVAQTTLPPSNDNFANQIQLNGSSWTVAGTTLNATIEAGEPIYQQNRPSVWYSWTAPSDLVTTINLAGSSNAPFVTISVGSTLATLHGVNQGGSFQGSVGLITFIAVKGVTYKIAVQVAGPGPGPFFLSLTSTPLTSNATVVGPDLPTSSAPANDNFANRKTLPSLPLTIVTYTGGASRETQEPVAGTNIYGTVWYSYTATADGFLNVGIESGSESRTEFSVLSGDTLNSLQRLADVTLRLTGSNSASLLMQKGATYHLQVGNDDFDSVRTVGRTVQLALSFTPAAGGLTIIGPDQTLAGGIPANNNFAQRKTVTGSAIRVLGYNINADKEAFEPVANPNSSLWYSWATDQSGTATITIGPLGIGQRLGVYTGTNLNALTVVPLTAVSGSNNRFTFAVLAGITYQIVLGSSGNDTGLVSFDLAGPGAGAGGVVTTTRLINIATRAVVATGGNLNPGFVIAGTGKKTVLVRAIGPGLANFGVPNTMADPRLVVFAGSTQIGTNDSWSANATEATALRAAFIATGAFALTDGSRDAALLLALDPGTYSALITGANGGGGDTIVEVYEVP